MKKNHPTRRKRPKAANQLMAEERYDIRILQSLRKIIRAVDLHSRKLAMQCDITAPQLVTLHAIIDYGPLTLAAVAREVHLSPSTLVGIIDRLESKHYVTRMRATGDRRQVVISATREGKAFARKAPSPLQEKLATALCELKPLEQATISLALERVVTLMEAEAIDAAPMLQTGAIDS